MGRARLGFWLGLLFALSAGCAAPYEPWSEFIPRGGGFALKLPARPKRTIEYFNGGLTVLRGYKVEQGFINYFLFRIDYPIEFIKVSSPKKLLERECKGLTEAALEGEGEVEGVEDITLDGYPGKEFFARRGGGRILSRLYMAGHRLYVLMVIYSADVSGAAEIGRFMDSFRIISD
jgi:hypothetical protein